MKPVIPKKQIWQHGLHLEWMRREPWDQFCDSENMFREVAELEREADQIFGGRWTATVAEDTQDDIERLLQTLNASDNYQTYKLMRDALQSAEQTLRNLGNGELTGDAATIALNAAANIRDILGTPPAAAPGDRGGEGGEGDE